MTARVHETADVEEGADVAESATVWRHAHVRRGARVGPDCVVGAGAFIDTGVVLGDRVKVQNNALVYSPAVVDDGAFVGPAAVLTNDRTPRAVTSDGASRSKSDWRAVGVHLRAGCSIGAHAVCVAPVTVGCWAMVAAGAVVTQDVADHALVAGVPARRIGWVGRAGVRLVPTADGQDRLTCPATGEVYLLIGDSVERQELP